jgi:hypothetical protein
MSQNRNCKNNVARHEEYFDCEKPLDDYPHHACSSWVWVNIDLHIKKEFGYTFEPWLGITVAYTHTCRQKTVKHLDQKRSASTTLGEASLRQYMSDLRWAPSNPCCPHLKGQTKCQQTAAPASYQSSLSWYQP